MLKSNLRECGIGLANGVLFAAVMGLIAAWWFSSESLGTVVAAATAINLLAAALAGILIPLTLDRLKIDPAVSSGVFVTMVTDVVGFFSFLGLATVWLL
jgi:magnesium transporter